MPTVSEFFGIVIRMYWSDHARPHFHAVYSGQKATYQIDPLEKMTGEISERANRLITEWAGLHRDELLAEWDVLSQNLPGRNSPDSPQRRKGAEKNMPIFRVDRKKRLKQNIFSASLRLGGEIFEDGESLPSRV